MWNKILGMMACVALMQCNRDPEVAQSPEAKLLSHAQTPTAAPVRHGPVQPIADDVRTGHATVRFTAEGEVGAPIIVLEEDHTIPAVQIEEVMILERLRASYRLRHIGLEGYMIGAPELETDWYDRAQRGDVAKARTAIDLVKEGEISSAEFMALLHRDVQLLAIEQAAEYDVSPGDVDVAELVLPLFALGVATLPPDAQAPIRKQLERAQATDHPLSASTRAGIVAAIAKDSSDTWIRGHIALVDDETRLFQLPIEDELEVLVHLKALVGDSLGSQWTARVDQYASFLAARSAASATMTRAIEAVADGPEVGVVAMVIGAGHSPRVRDILRKHHRPFAVLRPAAMDRASARRLSSHQFARHAKGEPVQPGPLADSLWAAFSDAHDVRQLPTEVVRHHSKPVIDQRWFQAKAELYELAETIGDRALTNHGQALGLGADELRGRLTRVDPSTIEVTTEPDGSRVAVFAVELNPDEPIRRQQLWMKVRTQGRTSGAPPRGEQQIVHDELMSALEEVGGGPGDKPSHKRKETDSSHKDRPNETDSGGKPHETHAAELRPEPRPDLLAGRRVKISERTVAAFGRTKQDVKSVNVSQF